LWKNIALKTQILLAALSRGSNELWIRKVIR
jgi:hypothetical protein